MARKPNPLKEEARQMYKAGKQLIDIAKQLSKPEGTIRRWKCEGKWDESPNTEKPNVRKEKIERSKKEKNIVKNAIKETMSNEKLSDKQQMFCIYYIQSFNATQSYINAYSVDWATANANASRLMGYDSVRQEIERLKEAKAKSIMVGKEDIVDLQMRIAFANISNYAVFGRKEERVWAKDKKGNQVPVIDPNTGEQKIRSYNVVDLKESSMADTMMIKSIKEGKDGISIQLEDRQKAIDWLTKFFELFPSDRRKDEFASKKLELEMLKIELSQKDDTPSEQEDDGFLECLNTTAGDVWGGDAN